MGETAARFLPWPGGEGQGGTSRKVPPCAPLVTFPASGKSRPRQGPRLQARKLPLPDSPVPLQSCLLVVPLSPCALSTSGEGIFVQNGLQTFFLRYDKMFCPNIPRRRYAENYLEEDGLLSCLLQKVKRSTKS